MLLCKQRLRNFQRPRSRSRPSPRNRNAPIQRIDGQRFISVSGMDGVSTIWVRARRAFTPTSRACFSFAIDLDSLRLVYKSIFRIHDRNIHLRIPPETRHPILADYQSLLGKTDRSVNHLACIMLAITLLMDHQLKGMRSIDRGIVIKGVKESETNEYIPGESLWWWAVNEINALLNVALQALCASFEELLLVVIQLREDIVGFFRSGGLVSCQQKVAAIETLSIHTPSSTGTEK